MRSMVEEADEARRFGLRSDAETIAPSRVPPSCRAGAATRSDAMEPMKPMQPMKPMEPMKPMDGGDAWWPKDLGSPSSSGSQNGMRYAFFPDKKRLVIETDGKTKTYDSGDHQISGVQQASGGRATFSDEDGTVELSDLKMID